MTLLDGDVTLDQVVARVAERLPMLVPSSLPDAGVLVVGDTIEYRCRGDAFRIRVQEIPWAEPIVAGAAVPANPWWSNAITSSRERPTNFRLNLAAVLAYEVRDGSVLDGVFAHRSYELSNARHRRVFVATTPDGGRFLLQTEAIKDDGTGAGVPRRPRPSPTRGSVAAEPPGDGDDYSRRSS